MRRCIFYAWKSGKWKKRSNDYYPLPVLPPLVRKELFLQALSCMFACLLACFVPDIAVASRRIQALSSLTEWLHTVPPLSKRKRDLEESADRIKTRGQGKEEGKEKALRSESNDKRIPSWAGEGNDKKKG